MTEHAAQLTGGPVTAGDMRSTPGKSCRSCGRVGEWPGQPCPECKPPASQDVVIAAPSSTTVLVRAEYKEACMPGPSLDELAAVANEGHGRVRLAGRELLEQAIRVGDALLQARARVQKGMWIAWATEHLAMEITTAYRYMRIAEFRKDVLASNVRSIEAAIQLLADRPRRGHGPRRYTDADKADWIKLADEIGVKPAARALGVSPSTMHAWTSPTSPSRGKSLASREVTADRIERVSEWLVGRFGGYDYPERVTPEVGVDAARLLHLIFEIPEEVVDA